jgi:EAL domain-containing protein (putative c-di-GMP-specific phosphodiesterase class I)
LRQVRRENLQMDADRHRSDPPAANIGREMPTPTIDVSSRFTIRAHDLRASGGARPRRYPVPDAGFCTATSVQGRPWLERLRRALRDDLFVLHYQPIVPLRPGRIGGPRPTHYEALIRLADEPEGQLVGPAQFLPLAERYGLVADIDRSVIARVVELLGEGAYGTAARMAVNLSALSVTDRGMLGFIEHQLARHRVEPERLIVEVTETAAISDMGLARSFCEGVQRLGSAVALDDFGAGFGSFQYLKQLPFQYLKIDGSFIRTLPYSHKDQLLVQALVGVACGMGKQTIAEYVALQSTIALLRDYGVDYAQGFQLGRPCAQPEAFAF